MIETILGQRKHNVKKETAILEKANTELQPLSKTENEGCTESNAEDRLLHKLVERVQVLEEKLIKI